MLQEDERQGSCAWMQERETGWVMVPAGPVLRVEDFASLAHLSTLSAVIIPGAKWELTSCIKHQDFWCRGITVGRNVGRQ